MFTNLTRFDDFFPFKKISGNSQFLNILPLLQFDEIFLQKSLFTFLTVSLICPYKKNHFRSISEQYIPRLVRQTYVTVARQCAPFSCSLIDSWLIPYVKFGSNFLYKRVDPHLRLHQFHKVLLVMQIPNSILILAFLAFAQADHGGHRGHHGGHHFRPSHHRHQVSHHRPHPPPQAPRLPANPDLVDIAVANPNFKTLVSIVSDLGLVETLKNAEALTIFAPDDYAFGKIPSSTLNSLSDEDKKTIVLRHVVAAKVPAAAVSSGPVKTLGGEEIELVKTPAGGVQINYNDGSSNVIKADVFGSNGVIHVIDKVIL